MKQIADKIIAELKALIELSNSIKEVPMPEGEYYCVFSEYDKRRNCVIETILFFQEELKPFEKEILEMVNKLEGRV